MNNTFTYINEKSKSKTFVLINNTKEAKKIFRTLQQENNYCIPVLFCLLSVMDKYNSCEITQQEVADMLSISREYTNRVFGILYDNKIIFRLSEDVSFFKRGTYFINQNLIAKQSLETLEDVKNVIPEYMQRNCKFKNHIVFDAHKSSFKFLIEFMKRNTRAFNLFFSISLRINMINVLLNSKAVFSLLKKAEKNIFNPNTISKYINSLKESGLLCINSYNKIQLNSCIVWSKYYTIKYYNSMFESDIAGVIEARHLNAIRYYGMKERLIHLFR